MNNLLEKTTVTEKETSVANAEALNNTLQHLIKNINHLFYKGIENGISEVISLSSDFNIVLFEAVKNPVTVETVKNFQKVFINAVYCILHHYSPKHWKFALDERHTIQSICSSRTLTVALNQNEFDGFDTLVCNFNDWTFTLSKAVFADLKTYKSANTSPEKSLINEKGDFNG